MRSALGRTIRGLLFATLLAGPIGWTNTMAAQLDENVSFSINAQPLGAALLELSKQASCQIVFSVDSFPEHTAPAISGTMQVKDALNLLLAGTELGFKLVGKRTITIGPVIPASSTRTPGASNAQHPSGQSVLRLVQAGNDPQVAEADQSPTRAVELQLEEVMVTGSHIRGSATPAGSKLLTLDRGDIERSGYGRMQDVLDTLPQNFGGNAREGFNLDAGAANLNRGHALDLRGLGISSTLVLIDGRRQSSGGLEGSFVDISSIPTAAVERVEVLPEGASAIYGSDAIGGVVNFVLRRDFDGAETSVRAATTDGHAEELQVSQLLGTHWSGGNVLLGYQYARRGALYAADGFYASMGNDYRSLGGIDYRRPRGNPGNILNAASQPVYAIPAGQDGTDLSSSDLIAGQVNYQDSVIGSAILPEQKTHNVFLHGSQQVTDGWEFFLDARYGTRDMRLPSAATASVLNVPDTNPFYVNPFGTNGIVRVAYDFRKDIGNTIQLGDTDSSSATLGTEVELGPEWKASLALTYGREENSWRTINQAASARIALALADTNPATALNVFGDGSHTNPATLEGLKLTSTADATSEIQSATFVVDGPLFNLPAGAVEFASGIDYRDETLDAYQGSLLVATNAFTRLPVSIGTMDRQVAAVFTELAVPVIGRDNGAPALELSIAGRYEDYSDFGSTFNPKFGVVWAVTDALGLRGTWGTAFRAPRLNELNPNVSPPKSRVSVNVLDPRSPTNRTNVLAISGNNPDLQEETADVWTLGLDWQVPGGLQASLTYFNYDYKDKIGTPPSSSTILTQESAWAEVISRSPTQAQIDAICARPDFTGECPAANTLGAIVDGRLRNLGGVHVDGLDVELAQVFNSAYGTFSAGLNGSYMLNYERAVSSSSPFVRIVDTVGNPLALRLRGNVGWKRAAWSTNFIVNYLGAYSDPANKKTVGAYTTLDASVAWLLANGSRALDGLRLSFNVVNALDRKPPFVDIYSGYDAANMNESGRLISVLLTKSW